MTFKEADAKLRETIVFELRHNFYQRESDIALFCEQVMTEKRHGEILQRKNKRLTVEQLEERLEIYTPVTKAIIAPIKSLYMKGYNSDNIREELKHDSDERLAEIRELAGRFHAGKSVSEYMKKKVVHANFRNPNDWIITERENKVRNKRVEQVVPYPFEVSSYQAVNYSINNSGEPEWLIAEIKSREVVRDVERALQEVEQPIVSDFYFYTAGLTVTYSEYVNKQPEQVIKGGIFIETVELTTVNLERQERKFVVEYFETGSKEFPGNKYGAISDPETEGFVKVPPYYDAEGLFIDIIDDKANMDVIKKRHVYPKRHEFVGQCKYQEDRGMCQNGFIDGIKTAEYKCPKCNGNGYIQFSSAQDKRIYPWPENLPEGMPMIDLSKMVFYEETQTEEVKLYDEFVDKATAKVTIAMFGVTSQTNPNPVMNKTATEVNYEQLNVNNPVLAVMEKSAELWMLVHRVSAQYMGYDEGFEAVQAFSKDLKIDGLGTLLAQWQASEGLGREVRWALECDILQKINQTTPGVVAMVKAKKRHEPFTDLSDEMVFAQLELLDNTDRDKVFYLYRSEIWTNIDVKVGEGFAKMAFEKQRDLIDMEIEKIIERVEYKEEEPATLPFQSLQLNGQQEPQIVEN